MILGLILCFSDPTKFFGCELGAQTQIDLKNERYIVNGAHDGEKLQEILDDFIQKFVLCPECENPETVLVSLQKYLSSLTLRGLFKGAVSEYVLPKTFCIQKTEVKFIPI